MFVPKKPKRIDFCGCPPCPLCYVWVEPPPPIEQVVEEPKEVDGIVKMGQIILGRDPTPDEMPALKRAAETIHEQNLLRTRDQQQAEAIRKNVDREQHIGMVCEAIIKDKARERNAPKPKELNTVNLDDMEEAKVRAACGLEVEPDKELLRRENKRNRTAQQEKERMDAYYNAFNRR